MCASRGGKRLLTPRGEVFSEPEAQSHCRSLGRVIRGAGPRLPWPDGGRSLVFLKALHNAWWVGERSTRSQESEDGPAVEPQADAPGAQRRRACHRFSSWSRSPLRTAGRGRLGAPSAWKYKPSGIKLFKEQKTLLSSLHATGEWKKMFNEDLFL